MYRDINPSPNFPEIERIILDFWKKSNSFEKRMTLNKGNKRWSFIDGPITANNPMGVHHAWGRTYKDLFQRYKAMKSYDLRFQNGFDCQGLWIEVEVEKELKLKTKKDIEKFGIEEFVKLCKIRVLKYAAIQVEQSKRLGYWMYWDDPDTLRYLAKKMKTPQEIITINVSKNKITDTVEKIVGKLGEPNIGGSYFTLSDENNYMIWQVLKKCYKKGWIYKGTDVLPWCFRCSTAISQHEIVTEGYKEITHKAITVKFPLKNRERESLLVWTTTPWTLTSNVAVAVNPEINYVKLIYNEEILYLAEEALKRVIVNDEVRILRRLKGKDMIDWEYHGPYDDLATPKMSGVEKAHKIISWNEVSEIEGTGIVHIAPGCGKEDLELGKKNGLPIVAPLDEFGIFKEEFGWLSGIHVQDSNNQIIENLKKRNLLQNIEDYKHRYPVCWRCGNELVFRLVDEWYISMGRKLNKPIEKVTKKERRKNLRYQIIESAKQVKWLPSYGLQQELDWLENMEDWMISKKRYWGLALPIWECPKCKNFEVIGSKKELKMRAIEGWDSFDGHSPHRPGIDGVKIMCNICGAKASRITDVGNPWLDAGIVAFSTLRYNKDRNYWKLWFPANLICESLPGQFRNWFYSMLAMSTILEEKTSFEVCFGHGLVLGEDGREMHKSWGNAIWFDEAVETIGADVMRWMYNTNRPETNLLFGYGKANEVKKQFFIPLWNIYSFFVTYAKLDRWTPSDSAKKFTLLDKWIISKLQILIKEVTRDLDNYDPYNAAFRIEEFSNDLSTQYIRRSRRRFWKSETDIDKKAAYSTLYTCLFNLIKLLAPFIPFITEEIYQNIVRTIDPYSKESIHHHDWPKPDSHLVDNKLMDNMNIAIKICSLGRSARSKSNIKLRQPLSHATIIADKKILNKLNDLKAIIRNELNVKELILSDKKRDLMEKQFKLKPSQIGSKYGRLFSKIKGAVDEINRKQLENSIGMNKPLVLKIDNNKLKIMPNDFIIEQIPKEEYSVIEEDEIIVGLNTSITNELKMSGLARDIVRRIQNQRKDAGFNISDWIVTYYKASKIIANVFKKHGDYIAAETLTSKLYDRAPPKGAYAANYKLEGEELTIGLIISERKDFKLKNR
ncbi:MAG: class I tRNA ligase family protein [Candidatus Bathyarchaeota archaeon]|nr:class I tRNA ligase family protein [Candidatus Bathyarchaeota archaeon]